ncbi:retrovirus-related pol polyprotein from transposon TNT 1-94 [Tanacetum coccineum]
MISPRVRDVYDMTSSAQESCFFSRASGSLNWLWHKRLSHLNSKTINQLAKQNLVIGLPCLVYSKDKPCSACEKGKHHKASFKTKQTSSIKKCLHLLHLDLFGHVTLRSINHEKYTLVIVDEYSSTWMTFRGNTRDLGSFGEETNEITDLHQTLEEVLLTERGDGITSIKRCRSDLFSDDVWNLETASGRGRLKEDLESSM